MAKLNSARNHLQSMEKKYFHSILKNDKSKKQRGQCHMLMGILNAIVSGVCLWWITYVQRLWQTRTRGETGSWCFKFDNNIFSEIWTNSFIKRLPIALGTMLPNRVNTNINKYYPVGTYGLRTLCIGAIHPDTVIIKKYFGGIVSVPTV